MGSEPLRRYLKFTELFSKLSPYELRHFSEVMLCKIEDGCGGKLVGQNSHSALTEKELKHALTQAMCDVAVHLRQRQINNQLIALTSAKAVMFTSDSLAA